MFYSKLIKQNKINSIIDFGCASGRLLFFCKNHPILPYGVDISKFAISYAKEKFEKNFKSGYFFLMQ